MTFVVNNKFKKREREKTKITVQLGNTSRNMVSKQKYSFSSIYNIFFLSNDLELELNFDLPGLKNENLKHTFPKFIALLEFRFLKMMLIAPRVVFPTSQVMLFSFFSIFSRMHPLVLFSTNLTAQFGYSWRVCFPFHFLSPLLKVSLTNTHQLLTLSHFTKLFSNNLFFVCVLWFVGKFEMNSFSDIFPLSFLFILLFSLIFCFDWFVFWMYGTGEVRNEV